MAVVPGRTAGQVAEHQAGDRCADPAAASVRRIQRPDFQRQRTAEVFRAARAGDAFDGDIGNAVLQLAGDGAVQQRVEEGLCGRIDRQIADADLTIGTLRDQRHGHHLRRTTGWWQGGDAGGDVERTGHRLQHQFGDLDAIQCAAIETVGACPQLQCPLAAIGQFGFGQADIGVEMDEVAIKTVTVVETQTGSLDRGGIIRHMHS